MQKSAAFLSRSIVRAALAVVSILSLPALGVTFDPPNPVEGSTVRIITSRSSCLGWDINVNVIERDPLTKGEPSGGRRIEITEFDLGWLAFLPPSCPLVAVTVGPLRKGRYNVLYYYAGEAQPRESQTLDVGPAAIVPTGGFLGAGGLLGHPAYIHDYSGFWMQPEGGSGISIQRDPGSGRMFAVWFTHTTSNWAPNLGIQTPTATWMFAPNLQFGPSTTTGSQSYKVLTADLYVARNSGPGSPSQLQMYPPFPILTETRKVGTFRFEQDVFAADKAVVTINLAPDSAWQSTFNSLFPQSAGQELRVSLSRYRF